MAATGVSGLDLYVRTDKGGGLARRGEAGGLTSESSSSAAFRRAARVLALLPLYNGTRSAELGVPEGAELSQGRTVGPGERKPIVFYGTSILQGGCASRPGMVAQRDPRPPLDHPHINLGFSGNGRMEREIAELLAELDPSIYVLDCPRT